MVTTTKPATSLDFLRRVRLARSGFLIAFIGLGFAPRTGRAELIYFRQGGEAQLPARIEGNLVVLTMPDGEIKLAHDEIRKMVPGFWPRTEWDTRRRTAGPASFDARLGTARWAIDNGLTMEVAPDLRELHALDPEHQPTARMAAILDRLDQPCADPDFGRFQNALGTATRVARGRHVILLHQHSEAEAEERVALLERVITGYYLVFAGQGIELNVPRIRLVSAWFGDQKDYLDFLRSEGAEVFGTTRGYYHPTWNSVVTFDARSTDPQRSARTRLEAKRDEIRRFGEMVEEAPARSRLKIKLADEPARTVGRPEAKALLGRVGDEITCETMLLDLDRRSVDLGTAAHEMIHQLAVVSHLVPRHDMFPVWLHEGIASQFEVIRGGRWGGVSRAHDLRLPDWRRLQSPLRLERLIRDSGFGRGYQRDLYAQAWALVYFLRLQKPGQFLTFIDLLRTPSLEGQSTSLAPGDRVFDAFQRAFGIELDRLDGEWHTFMKTVQTPLEQNAEHSEPASKASRPGARAKY
jgi:Protein of unknown function (DUF1570)